MNKLIRCPECEGWGITSYNKDASANTCSKCNGARQIAAPIPAVVVYYHEPLEILANEALASIGCGATVGHGSSCAKGYTCSACDRLEKLAKAAIEYLEQQYD